MKEIQPQPSERGDRAGCSEIMGVHQEELPCRLRVKRVVAVVNLGSITPLILLDTPAGLCGRETEHKERTWHVARCGRPGRGGGAEGAAVRYLDELSGAGTRGRRARGVVHKCVAQA